MVNYSAILVILFVAIVHVSFINPIEKLITQIFYIDRRPLQICSDKNTFKCLGMPSGHMETGVVVFLLLYLNKIIPSYIALIMIILIAIQRIVTKMHTILQVIAGLLLGLIYTILYHLINEPKYIILCSVIIAIILMIIYKYLTRM